MRTLFNIIFFVVFLIISNNPAFADASKVDLDKGLTIKEFSKLRTYKEWKFDKIQDSKAKIAAYKTMIETLRAKKPDQNRITHQTESGLLGDISSQQAERLLKQESTNLEVAHDLTLTDYIIGYISKIHNKQAAILEVSSKLSQDEVAELMNIVMDIQVSSSPKANRTSLNSATAAATP